MRPRGPFLSNESGVVALEFALIVPVLLVILFGSYEGTRMARASMRLNDAAQTIADLVAQQVGIDAAKTANFCDGAGVVMTPFTSASLKATVASATRYTSGVAVDWQDTTCGSGNSISSAATLAEPYVSAVKDSVVIVQAVYSYRPVINLMFASDVTLTRTAYARPRNGKSVTHS